MANEPSDHTHTARSWVHFGGRCCASAVGNILEAQRRIDAGGLSVDAVKAAIKDLDDARAHLVRALIHYEMAEEKSDA
jgi:hypothetical protein